ncbi:PREDICTED: uncharacterized protein LOC104777763 [Camelina sativa]|uniref:Uncharacterized protein LOC104777763 n=1 Tax=Camelina sativa TaxID=90675 RepID=A0ABM0YG29_CAMSA|nr:PREDICTED: uncharacterized protein LOC104777763 [Camelina sativa]XP_010500374.1 PREDICTED: uncharacterized protein LOC104777763 [Camelina sativa]XP_010500375.1 PREDICTED: uncharacterized protein LOC104777763 [Camelina sativa]XP_010500376.1 PREDICTED: uncharacterized protein LOC104777763 [Camelina sativa]
MESKAICLGFLPPRLRFSFPHLLSNPCGLSTFAKRQRLDSRQTLVWNKPQLSRGRVLLCSSNAESRPGNKQFEKSNYARAELFRGKSGSVSFNGLTHQLVEESKLVSAPFQEEKGSLLWLLAPVVLIASFILPQFFLTGAIEATFKNDTVAEIVTSFCLETVFYAGLAIFLSVTDRVQRPYLDFSSKRWGLITGLRGYLTSAFLTMGLKVVVPVFAVYMTWPTLGIDALIAVLPFLVGCAVQRVFEARLERRGSSCWPIVPIVFEVYRLYQVTRAATFVQRLMFMMKDAATTAEITERGVALVGLVVTLQFLAVMCLWSFITFLMRLFPSRPVGENY